MKRREFMGMCAAPAIVGTIRPDQSGSRKEDQMYGLIGKITAHAGKRDELMDVLLTGAKDMPGCVNYVAAKDNSDADAVWVTEIWVSQASHQASLKLPDVENAIAKGRPLIAGFGDRVVTTPIGGIGFGLIR
jgi:quinol monooxygenase YgiN